MKRKRTAQSAPAGRSLDEGGFFNLRASIAVLLCVLVGCSVLSATLLGFFSPQASLTVSERTLSFAERVTYQRAIEDVYWRHRIWPGADPKPPLGSVMSQAQIENKIADYLCKSQALEDYWQRPVTAEQLQAEINRMAANTKQPGVLRELFEALGNDPFVIAECLAKPIAAERLLVRLDANERIGGESKQSVLAHAETKTRVTNAAASRRTYMLPEIGSPLGGCTEDTWTPTSTTNAPNARGGHTALWTGSEMIVWGGFNDTGVLNTGGRYNPGTDSWTATSTANAPVGRQDCSVVWAGSEMIVWGGYVGAYLNTGGRYNPTMDSWTATSITNAPTGRYEHTAVLTGTEMIVWGGFIGPIALNDGGKYNPGTDSWTATSTTGAPSPRGFPTSVWTSSEMIVWGGWNDR